MINAEELTIFHPFSAVLAMIANRQYVIFPTFISHIVFNSRRATL